MKLLLEIHDDDLGLERFKISKYEERIGARAVILNKGKIALLYAGKKNHHKLPGGKAELNESINDCLMREVFEETGCRIKVIKEIGMVIEYRSKVAIKQTSYCFLAEAVSCSTPKFVKEEIEEECELEWVTLDEAISMLSKERSKGYKGKFILKRELVFLEEVKKME